MQIGLPPPGPEDSQYLSLIVPPDAVLPYEEGQLCILAIELYESGCIVQWHINGLRRAHADKPDSEGRWHMRANPAVSVRDDRGQQYQRDGGHLSAGQHHINGHSAFKPGLDEGTRWLRVMIDGTTFTVDLV